MMSYYYYRPKRLTDRELLETFPEAKQLVPSLLRDLKESLMKKEEEIVDFLKTIHSHKADSFSEYFAETFAQIFLMPDITACKKNIFRLRRLQSLFYPSKYNADNFQEKIEKARDFPILELAKAKMELRPSGKRFTARCPFHNEKTPSFFVYPENNSFHCFGCQEHGDVINLTMALCGVGFKDAVLMLQY